MSSSNHNVKHPQSLALKQAADWRCSNCGRQCRRQGESLEDFAARIRHEADIIAAHPRRWTLHVTKYYGQPMMVLCGSCHSTYHNYHRWRQRQQQQRQQQEQSGQLTLNDIRLPLTGLQLSLNEWGSPYEIVNPTPRKR